MHRLLSTGLRLRSDERAVTALEYGMIVALIVSVIVASVTTLGVQVNSFWVKAVNAL